MLDSFPTSKRHTIIKKEKNLNSREYVRFILKNRYKCEKTNLDGGRMSMFFLKKFISMKRAISLLLSVLILTGSSIIATRALKEGYSSPVNLLEEKYHIGTSQIIYNNTFNESSAKAPVTLFREYRRSKNIVENKRWRFVGEIASESGLLSHEVSSFVYSFEFQTKQQWSTANFIFHDSTGWPGAYSSYLSLRHNEDGSAIVPTLYVEGESIQNPECKMKVGEIYEVVLIAQGCDYSLYIWQKGYDINEPTIQMTVSTPKKGDFYFYSYQADTYVDNIRVYDLSKLNMNTEDATVVYENDFNKLDTASPMGISGVVTDNAFMVSGQTISGSALTGIDTLSEMQFEIEYRFINLDFSEELWTFGDKKASLLITPSKLKISCEEESSVLPYSFKIDKTYQIVVRCQANKLKLFIWEKGSLAPISPSVECNACTLGGDIGYSAIRVNAVWDNIKVYDLSTVSYGNELTMLADWNFDDSNEKIPIEASEGMQYDNGTLRFMSDDTQTTNSFFEKNVGDFFWQFDYIPTSVSDNEDSFLFHINEKNSSSLSLTLLGNNKAVDGNNLILRSKNKEGINEECKVAVDEWIANQCYTIRIVFIGDMVLVKLWKQGYGTPNKYILYQSVDVFAYQNGDFALQTVSGNFAVDRMTIYNGIPDMTTFDEEKTILEPINQVKKIAEYRFDDPHNAFPMQIDENGVLSYNENKLYVQTNWSGKDVWTSAIGDQMFKDFTWQFEYTTTEMLWNVDFFVFHSQGKDISNCLALKINGGGLSNEGDNVFLIQNDSGVSTTLTSAKIEGLNGGIPYKIRIVMKDNNIQVWFWESGTATPQNPSMTGIATSEKLEIGETHLYCYQSFYYLDDVIIYQGVPDRSLLDETATTNLQNKECLIDTDFSKSSDLITEPKEPSVVEVKDEVLHIATGAQQMYYGSPLASGAIAEDFSWQFTYCAKQSVWNNDYFVFHSNGSDEGPAIMLRVLGSGNAANAGGDNLFITQRGGIESINLDSTSVPLVLDVPYTIRIICSSGKVDVYFWIAGTNTPEEPVLSATITDRSVRKGCFILQSFNGDFTIDDMRLYNYADGYQKSTFLKTLPDNVNLLDYNFNGLRGKTDFPFQMKDSLKYWQNTLKINTPVGLAVNGNNLVGDYPLDDLCWEFEMRDFERWSVNRFIIHSTDGSLDNCIELLYMGYQAKMLDGYDDDKDHSAFRLIQVIDGKKTLIGKYDADIKLGKAYNIKIISSKNKIEIYFGEKRNGIINKIISAQASEVVNKGYTFIAGYQINMWLDNLKLSNAPFSSNEKYAGSLTAITK